MGLKHLERSDQIRSVAQSYPTLCDPMNRSTPGLPVHHQLLEFTETHVHRVSDAIQPSHPLSSPSPQIHSLYTCKFQLFCYFSTYQVGKYLSLVRQGPNKAVRNWYLHALLVVIETDMTPMEGILAIFSDITHTHTHTHTSF